MMTSPSTDPCPQKDSICANAIFLNSNHTIFLRNRNIVVEENKKKYIANNVNGECIARVMIDNGIIKNTSESKTDYMLIRCEHNIVYLIELKGGDVTKACEQIFSTISHLSSLLPGATIHARIICSRAPAPALRSSQYVRLDRFCCKNKGKLIVKVTQFEEKYVIPCVPG